MAALKSLMIEWGVKPGMQVTGAKSPYDFLRKCFVFNTKDAFSLAEQELLLMAAQNDRYMPLHQFLDHAKMLTQVRSLTTRFFTRKEQAQNHCYFGNRGLSLEVIAHWLEETMKHAENKG